MPLGEAERTWTLVLANFGYSAAEIQAYTNLRDANIPAANVVGYIIGLIESGRLPPPQGGFSAGVSEQLGGAVGFAEAPAPAGVTAGAAPVGFDPARAEAEFRTSQPAAGLPVRGFSPPSGDAGAGADTGTLSEVMFAFFDRNEIGFLGFHQGRPIGATAEGMFLFDLVDGVPTNLGFYDPTEDDGLHKGAKGAAGRAPRGYSFVGVDNTTGRGMFMNLDTGEQTLGATLDFPGFRGIDPEREFQERLAAGEATRADLLQGQRMSEAELARQVLSRGGDFLFREAFNRGAIPSTGFVSMEDLLRTAIPGFGGAGAMDAVTGAIAPGGLPSGAGFAPGVEGVNPAQRTDLAQLSRETIAGGPIREVLGGEGFISTSGAPFRTPTPQMLRRLTSEQVGATQTASLSELNTPLEDIAKESALGFLPPDRRTRARAIVV